MAFSVPTFNLTVDIYTGPYPGLLRLSSPCNLAMGRRIQLFNEGASPTLDGYGSIPSLLLPKLTDIRDQTNGIAADYVEVPAGSQRWYLVGLVDDVAKGFTNEYRFASLGKIFQGALGAGTFPGLFWTVPYN